MPNYLDLVCVASWVKINASVLRIQAKREMCLVRFLSNEAMCASLPAMPGLCNTALPVLLLMLTLSLTNADCKLIRHLVLILLLDSE